MSDWIDDASKALGEVRNRPQMAQHVRTVEIQTLDALLRIEEALEALTRTLVPLRPVAVTDELTSYEPVSKADVKLSQGSILKKKNSKYL